MQSKWSALQLAQLPVLPGKMASAGTNLFILQRSRSPTLWLRMGMRWRTTGQHFSKWGFCFRLQYLHDNTFGHHINLWVMRTEDPVWWHLLNMSEMFWLVRCTFWTSTNGLKVFQDYLRLHILCDLTLPSPFFSGPSWQMRTSVNFWWPLVPRPRQLPHPPNPPDIMSEWWIYSAIE